jgi:hypothetical protein
LIPLKARAYLDLIAHQTEGAAVDSKDIKKHRADVFRLFMTLAPADRFPLTAPLREDMTRFLACFPLESPEWANIKAAVRELPAPRQVVEQLRGNFGLG